MILLLQRRWYEDGAVIGTLYLDGVEECFTLESDDKKIPEGKYSVLLTTSDRVRRGTLWSPRKDASLPLVSDVPGRSGIRFHAGNDATDTEGCILVGKIRGSVPGHIFGSRAALSALVDKIAGSRYAVTLTVE